VLGLTRLRFQTIVMCHYQEKVVHVLLFVVQFIILDANDYFVLVAFQMAWPTLYVTWHIVLFTSDCKVHVQILTCLN